MAIATFVRGTKIHLLKFYLKLFLRDCHVEGTKEGTAVLISYVNSTISIAVPQDIEEGELRLRLIKGRN